ncbi:hypothetical protein AB0J20_10765 [Micromonospora costi]
MPVIRLDSGSSRRHRREIGPAAPPSPATRSARTATALPPT